MSETHLKFGSGVALNYDMFKIPEIYFGNRKTQQVIYHTGESWGEYNPLIKIFWALAPYSIIKQAVPWIHIIDPGDQKNI